MKNLAECLMLAWPSARRTTLWLLRLMLPISLAVSLLQYFGIIAWAARYLDPLFVLMGLPGRAAIAFLTGAFVTTYAGLAVTMSLALTLRQATIVAVMTCICHALPMECAVVRRCGSSFWGMAVLRLIMAVAVAFYLNALLPAMDQPFATALSTDAPTLTAMLWTWLQGALKTSLLILSIIYILMVIQRLMERYGLVEKISRRLTPLMRLFGLPANAAYMWVVGNVLGISYGSAVMIDMEEKGLITRDEANDVNYHLVMNHSMLEDTLVFASMGVSAWWILSTRVLFALLVVWARRALNCLNNYGKLRGS